MIGRRLFLGAGATALLAACSPGANGPAAEIDGAGEWHGTHLSGGGNPVPDVTLTDQDGNPFNLATDVTTKALALFFGYTNCPDVCPGIMADMATAKRRLPPEIVDDITLIVVTTDPARDTPEALKEYLRRVDESFIGLTGSLDLIKPAALSLGIDIAEGKQLPSGGYEVDHGSYILGFGEDRKLAVVWNEVPPGEMREDYERLIGG
ncbi:SCO family protein [Tessaracoccus sp. ZS01]|uniref:SCO family protein n=1 Tax=Tessaracoccus sp. ZS01 TaxID=1906324 RepID=UPI001301337A|nr:SCO family protein [Tessaracoccus sp. ZS01]